jgi:hypothetical protein
VEHLEEPGPEDHFELGEASRDEPKDMSEEQRLDESDQDECREPRTC